MCQDTVQHGVPRTTPSVTNKGKSQLALKVLWDISAHTTKAIFQKVKRLFIVIINNKSVLITIKFIGNNKLG